MSRKMILIPLDRYSAMLARSKEPDKRPESLEIPPAVTADIEVKIEKIEKESGETIPITKTTPAAADEISTFHFSSGSIQNDRKEKDAS